MAIEMLRYTSLGIDALIIASFIMAGIYGYRRDYRKSMAQLGIQLLSIILSFGLTFILGNLLMSKLPVESLSTKVQNLIPDNLSYIVQPIQSNLIGLIVYVILFISFFVVIKSFLDVFSKNYQWSQYLLKNKTLDTRIEKTISVCSTLVTSYTYIIVVVIVLAFPVLNISKSNSFSRMLIKTVPDVSNTIQTLYTDYDAINQAVSVYGKYVNVIYDGTTINFNEIKKLIDSKEIDSTVIDQAYAQLMPRIANEKSYLSYFENNIADVPQMSQYIRTMSSYIENGVLTLEIFNSYYKELIDNGTYDKLVQDEVINKDSLQLLIQSNLLNEEIVEKLKEY